MKRYPMTVDGEKRLREELDEAENRSASTGNCSDC